MGFLGRVPVIGTARPRRKQAKADPQVAALLDPAGAQQHGIGLAFRRNWRWGRVVGPAAPAHERRQGAHRLQKLGQVAIFHLARQGPVEQRIHHGRACRLGALCATVSTVS